MNAEEYRQMSICAVFRENIILRSRLAKLQEEIACLRTAAAPGAVCDHEWESYGISSAGAQYRCRLCGKIDTRKVRYNNDEIEIY